MSNDTLVLSSYEYCLYFVIWISGVFYSVYNVYCSNKYINYFDSYIDFTRGWSWVGRPRDVTDTEWNVWISLTFTLMPWIVINHIGAQILKTISNSLVLYWWYISVSLSFMYYHFGLPFILCTLVQPSLMYFLICTNSKTIIWSVHILALLLIQYCKIPNGIFQVLLQLDSEEHYMLMVTLCWLLLKSISQNIHDVDSVSKNERLHFLENFSRTLAYSLYLPLLFMGPFVLYDKFIEGTTKPFQRWNFKILKKLALNMIRYISWLYFTELILHFIYFNALKNQPEVVQNLSSWALYGLGYCMGQYFLNKYVVIYGIYSTLCESDGIEGPPQPKCIGRIHLYSDMWKHFDRGLYTFLVKYIYVPSMKRNFYFSKLFSSFLCFLFVFMWHGMQVAVFIWSLLNYIGIVIEIAGKAIAQNQTYKRIAKYFGPQSVERFNCLLTSPLLAMAAISNFFFFADEEVGNIYIQRTLQGSWVTLSTLIFFIYCFCNTSVYIKNWEIKKASKKL